MDKLPDSLMPITQRKNGDEEIPKEWTVYELVNNQIVCKHLDHSREGCSDI